MGQFCSTVFWPRPTQWISGQNISHLCMGLPSGLFPSGFPTKTLYEPHHSSTSATWPTQHILLDFITSTILGWEYRPLSSSLCTFFHFLVSSSLLESNILLNTLFSNNLSLYYSLNVSDQVSYTHTKVIGGILGLFIFTLNFWIATSKTKDTSWNEIKHSSTVHQQPPCNVVTMLKVTLISTRKVVYQQPDINDSVCVLCFHFVTTYVGSSKRFSRLLP